MIKIEIIQGLYKKYPQPAQFKNNLNFELFTKGNMNHHTIEITEECLKIHSLETDSPFHEIPLRNISGIEELDNHIAIILRNSILFLSKENDDIRVHINIEHPSLWERVKYMFNK